MINDGETKITIERCKSKIEAKDNPESFYKALRNFARNCEQKNFKQISALVSKDGKFKVNFNKFRNNQVYRRQLLEQYTEYQLDQIYQQFKDADMIDDLLFLSAAKFDLEELKITIQKFSELPNKEINQTRNEDNVITFLLKYCNISQNHDVFMSCANLLINAGIDIKKYDIKGKTALDYTCSLSKLYKKENSKVAEVLKNFAELCLKTGVYEITDEQTNNYLKESNLYKKYPTTAIDPRTELYLMIIKNDQGKFKEASSVDEFANETNYEHTFLQLACKNSDNNVNIVKQLLESGANPNLTTERRNETPLEIAGRKNHVNIFKLLLANKKTEVTEQQYNNFVRIRSAPMKCKLFEMLLLSDKLKVDYKSDSKLYQPIHYAIIFNHKEAIAKLLKRGSSLYEKNANDKCSLDIIEISDLKKHLDACISKDTYKEYLGDPNYKLHINFTSLINPEQKQELCVVNQIAANRGLRELILHPLIHFLLSLKWAKCQKYFYATVLLQAALFLFMSFYFYFIHKLSFLLGILIVILNIPKLFILLNFESKDRRIGFPAFKHEPFHSLIELKIIITSLLILILFHTSLTSYQRQLRAFIFVEMAIAFLLTCGYHPKLSKWSLMLQRVFKTFSNLFIFFSLIVFGFSAGFHILFEDDEEQQLFKNFFTSILKTYIMTTAEFDINGVDFSSSGIGGYLIFGIFAMTMSLVIVNFWTGVAVTDIERIQKDSELNAFKNVMVFLDFIDIICSKKIFKFILGESHLFQATSHGDYKSVSKTEKRIAVDFFLNKDIQIDKKDYPKFPQRVDNICLEKLKTHCSEQVVPQEESIAEILDKLKSIQEKLETLKIK